MKIKLHIAEIAEYADTLYIFRRGEGGLPSFERQFAKLTIKEKRDFVKALRRMLYFLKPLCELNIQPREIDVSE